MNRREFIKRSALGALSFQVIPSRLLGRSGVAPSNRINVAIIGNGNISFWHRVFFSSSPETQVLALCDVHRDRLMSAKAHAEKITKNRTDTGFKPIDVYMH